MLKNENDGFYFYRRVKYIDNHQRVLGNCVNRPKSKIFTIEIILYILKILFSIFIFMLFKIYIYIIPLHACLISHFIVIDKRKEN